MAVFSLQKQEDVQRNVTSLREPRSLVCKAAVSTRTWAWRGFQLGFSSLTQKVQTQNADRLKEKACVVFILQTVFFFPPETRQEPRIILFV